MNKRKLNIDKSTPSLSIETLQDIIQNCQRNEQRLKELERHTRHERKRVERLLQEKSNQVQEDQEQQQQPVKFFITLDNDKRTIKKKSSQSRRQQKQNRVRFDVQTDRLSSVQQPNLPSNNIEEFDDLARRCEDLLLRLRIHTKQSKALQSHEPFNPSFHSIDKSIKQTLDDNNTSQESLLSEIQRRNYLRTEILRSRLRQHLLLPGRPNDNQVSQIIDT
ncbi:hypothetical protein I4U23_013055 [Adineta vaga]|nr:hypothetical protein I4U23_013055 [Adineta vaga]